MMNKFLTSKFFQDTVWGIVRHGLTAVGGSLITEGYMTSDQMNGLIGSGFFLFGIGWSIYKKHVDNKDSK